MLRNRMAARLVPCSLLAVAAIAAEPAPTRVIIIGVDGLGGASLNRSNSPNIRSLMNRGAWSLKARGVMPTLSSPNWASILTGAGPEQHGITSNGWFKRLAQFQPTCSGPAGIFPTIFAWLRQQRPSAVSAVFHHWSGIAKLIEPGMPDVTEHRKGATETMDAARQYWMEHQPDLMFVHLLNVDNAGHFRGWNSRAYFRAVEHADRLIGQMVKTLEEKDALRNTLIIVTSDHGGSGHIHGRNSMIELEIPWIAAGPGVPENLEITAPISTTDTAPTVADVLGLRPSSCATGRPVESAFAGARRREAVRTAAVSPVPLAPAVPGQ